MEVGVEYKSADRTAEMAGANQLGCGQRRGRYRVVAFWPFRRRAERIVANILSQ